MFVYGTNDFGETKCKTNGAEDCPCYCETSYNKDGECKLIENNGYNLYKYKEGKKKGKSLYIYIYIYIFYSLIFF